MSVDGEIGDRERAIVLEKIPGHPVILLRACNVADSLAEDVPVELGASFA